MKLLRLSGDDVLAVWAIALFWLLVWVVSRYEVTL